MDSLDLDALERLEREANDRSHTLGTGATAKEQGDWVERQAAFTNALRNAAPELLQRARGYDLMREALTEIAARAEMDIDGAPDRGPCAHLANEVFHVAAEALHRAKTANRTPDTPQNPPKTEQNGT